MNSMFLSTEIYNNPDEPTIPEILQYVDVSKWDTSNVTDMIGMFVQCRDITSLEGISNWDTSNVTNMSAVFAGCSSLTSLDLSNWDTSKVTQMVQMFSECDNLSTIIGTIDLTSCSNYPYSISLMFSCSNSLTSVNIKLPGTGIDSSKENDFVSESGVSSKDIVNFIYDDWNLDRNFITSAEDSIKAPYTFDGTYGPIPNENGEVDLSNYARIYIDDYTEITELPEENKAYLDEVLATGKYKVTNMSSMFTFCTRLTSLDASNWDTSKVTDMPGMFVMCQSLTSLNLSNWDTSNVTNMNSMFSNCQSLTSLNLSNWDTSNVTNMNSMFFQCLDLQTITGTIDLTRCTNYSYMFQRTQDLTSINIKLPSTITQSDFLSESGVTNKSAVHFVS